MALGPKAMGEAILRNLKAKTGKELSEWLQIVEKSGLTDKKPVIAFLKNEYGLGHFQAQKVFEQFTGKDMYKNRDSFIKELFKSAQLMERYEQLERVIRQLGEDVKVEPCKTYIPFYRNKQFAIVTVSALGQVMLGLNLPAGFEHKGFTPSKTPASERINFVTSFDRESIIGESIRGGILQSYNLN